MRRLKLSNNLNLFQRMNLLRYYYSFLKTEIPEEIWLKKYQHVATALLERNEMCFTILYRLLHSFYLIDRLLHQYHVVAKVNTCNTVNYGSYVQEAEHRSIMSEVRFLDFAFEHQSIRDCFNIMLLPKA